MNENNTFCREIFFFSGPMSSSFPRQRPTRRGGAAAAVAVADDSSEVSVFETKKKNHKNFKK
jgi:hypothetical protein